jgi:hypothetical protein
MTKLSFLGVPSHFNMSSPDPSVVIRAPVCQIRLFLGTDGCAEARDMYARACEMNPTNPVWLQEYGHMFQNEYRGRTIH